MSVAWIGVGVAAAGAIGSYVSAEDGIAAQEDAANKAASQNESALKEQVRQADELLAFNKQQYADSKERQVGIDAITKQVVQQNLDLSQKAGERADDSYNFYKQNGRPVVQKTLEEANGFDSQSNIDLARGRAAADVQSGFESADKQSQTALSRMGINPSSGRFLALQQSMQAQKAAALAGALTGAENQTRNQAINMRQQASNLAQGFPAQTTADGGQSGNQSTSAGNMSQNSMAGQLAIGAQNLGGMATGAGILGSAAGGYQNVVNSANNQANIAQQQAAASQAGWGNLAGIAGSAYKAYNTPTFGSANAVGGANGAGFGSGAAYGNMDLGIGLADGGVVQGPGTGISDSVPAQNVSNGAPIRLSNGEYVISADVVKAKGTEFFDALQAKHHKPVNIGRAA